MKTLTAEDAMKLCQFGSPTDYMRQLDAIANGAHEVIDRATTRGVSIADLQRYMKYMRHSNVCDRPRKPDCSCGLNDALAEIDEVIRDA